MPALRFPARVVTALDATKYLGIRTGKAEHRFIGIWVVVADGRVFVRSWDVKPTGWYATLRREPVGELQVGDRVVRFKGRRVSSERLLAAIDQAYADKYDTKASLKYVVGFRTAKRRGTTTELVPR